jgi:hypothetical protein
MNHLSAIEKRDYSKIDKLNALTNKDTFWDDVRKLTKNVTSDHSIKRWQCLADQRWQELVIVCSNCKKEVELTIPNSYGESLCNDCWDDYIITERGKLEYFVSLVRGEEDLRAFDADELGEIVVSWNKYKFDTEFSKKEIEQFEIIAARLNLM